MRLTLENIYPIIDSFQKEIRENTARFEDYIEYFKFIKKINPTYKQTIEGIIDNSEFKNLQHFITERNKIYSDKSNLEEFFEFSQKETPILLKIQSAGRTAILYNSLYRK